MRKRVLQGIDGILKATPTDPASIAQWLERWSSKPEVVSSILTGGYHSFALLDSWKAAGGLPIFNLNNMYEVQM